MASTTDKVTDTRNAARPNSARVSSGRSGGGTTLACDNLTGWPTASKVHFVTYKIDSNSVPVAGTQLDCTGIVSGNNIGSLTVIDGSDTGNAVNDIVEMLPTAAWGQDLADALTAQHSRTGTHKNITTDTLTVTSGSTLPAGDIGTADIADSAITSAKILNGTIAFADLLSTIFSGQVSTQANAGTAGGTMWWINLGGVKLLWGSSTTCNTSATPVSFTFTLPVFFTTIQANVGLINGQGSQANQVTAGSAVSTSSVATYLTSPGGAATATYSIFVIGT